MPPRYDTYIGLLKGSVRIERLRFLGVVVEWFWYLAFGRPRRGLYALEPGDVDEVELWSVTNEATGVQHRSALVSVSQDDAAAALTTATSIVERLEGHGLRVLEALPAGPPRIGDHDLVVERRGARGKGSMEVKLMQIGAVAMTHARDRERGDAQTSRCWLNARKTRDGYVERFLAIWHMCPPSTGGTLEDRLARGRLRIDVLRAVSAEVWEWAPFAGWAGFNLGNVVAPAPAAAARSRSPPRAGRAAAAAPAPKAAPKAAPRPGAARPSWQSVVNAVPQKDRLRKSNGITYFHARRIIAAMGLTTWASHLYEKIPKCIEEFSWAKGVDYLQEAGGHRGIPPYWLTPVAARQVYDRFA